MRMKVFIAICSILALMEKTATVSSFTIPSSSSLTLTSQGNMNLNMNMPMGLRVRVRATATTCSGHYNYKYRNTHLCLSASSANQEEQHDSRKSNANTNDNVYDNVYDTDNSNDNNDNNDNENEHEQEHETKTTTTTTIIKNFGAGDDSLGGFNPSKKIPVKREVLVGNPQLKVKKKEKSVSAILQELAEIQQQGPRKYCILGTRHCSYLHQQIIELLSYALVLSENHVYTSGAGGTNAAAIRGALRAERPDLLTVILPQSKDKQPDEIQELLSDVTDLVTMPQNDAMSLNVASRVCNSKLLSETDQLIAFAFHESKTVIEATKEAKKLEMLVTMLFLD